MNRAAATTLVIGLIVGFAIGSAGGAHAAGQGPCTEEKYEVHLSESTTAQHTAVKALIRCAVRKWAVEGGAAKAISVAECESSLFKNAKNGTYEGLYQIGNWEGARATYLKGRHWYFPRWGLDHGTHVVWKPSAFNARAHVIVAIRWVHALGWAPWAGCA